MLQHLITGFFGCAWIATLIMFFVTRHDNKKGYQKQVEQNTEDISTIKSEMEIFSSMCLGALYDRTKYLAEFYIKKGNITLNEYNDWLKYLYEPYNKGGGDGTIDDVKEILYNLLLKSSKVDKEE